jgi:hypothetical protein
MSGKLYATEPFANAVDEICFCAKKKRAARYSYRVGSPFGQF